MRTFLTRFAVVSLFLISLLGAGAGAALAAPGTGTGATQFGDQINITDCQGQGNLCFTAKGEYHGVETAAGAFNGQANFQYACFTEYDGNGAVIGQLCLTNVHIQLHLDSAGDVQVVHVAGTLTLNNGTSTCTETANFHFTSNGMQYGGFDGTCF